MHEMTIWTLLEEGGDAIKHEGEDTSGRGSVVCSEIKYDNQYGETKRYNGVFAAGFMEGRRYDASGSASITMELCSDIISSWVGVGMANGNTLLNTSKISYKTYTKHYCRVYHHN